MTSPGSDVDFSASEPHNGSTEVPKNHKLRGFGNTTGVLSCNCHAMYVVAIILQFELNHFLSGGEETLCQGGSTNPIHTHAGDKQLQLVEVRQKTRFTHRWGRTSVVTAGENHWARVWHP